MTEYEKVNSILSSLTRTTLQTLNKYYAYQEQGQSYKDIKYIRFSDLKKYLQHIKEIFEHDLNIINEAIKWQSKILIIQ